MSNDDVPDGINQMQGDTKRHSMYCTSPKNLPPELVCNVPPRRSTDHKDDYALKKASVSRRHGQFGKSKSAEKSARCYSRQELRTVSRQYYAQSRIREADRRVKLPLKVHDSAEHSVIPIEKVDHRRRPRPAQPLAMKKYQHENTPSSRWTATTRQSRWTRMRRACVSVRDICLDDITW